MNYIENKLFEDAKKFIKTGKYVEANNIINQMILESSDNPEVMKNVGKLYIVMGKYNLASVYIRQSFELKKSYETLKLLADVNFEAGKFDMAAIEYEELIKNEPSEIMYERCITSYEKLDFYEEAIRVARMYHYATESIVSYEKLIHMYITAGMEDMAIFTADDMQKKFPNDPITYNTLGFLHECIYNDYKQAKEYFKKAIKMGLFDAYYNMGVCCTESEDFDTAEKYLKKLIALNPEMKADYNYVLGSIYLTKRKLRMGYKYYQNRLNVVRMKQQIKKRLWDGKKYPKETLYVNAEQGYGDNIIFVRYLPETLKYFKKVIYATRTPLINLFQESFPKEKYPNIEIVSQNEIIKYNKYAYIMDLPYLVDIQ